MRYFLATPSTFAFRPFAFAPPRRSAGSPFQKHLTRRPSKAIGDRFTAEHPRQLLHAAAIVKARHRRPRPATLDSLFNLEMRIGVRGNLRQVRDAQNLKRRAQ